MKISRNAIGYTTLPSAPAETEFDYNASANSVTLWFASHPDAWPFAELRMSPLDCEALAAALQSAAQQARRLANEATP